MANVIVPPRMIDEINSTVALCRKGTFLFFFPVTEVTSTGNISDSRAL